MLIEAINHYYRFNFCIAFWHWPEIASSKGMVKSIAINPAMSPVSDAAGPSSLT